MIIKVFIIAFIAFVLFRTFLKFRQKDITIREFFIWLGFWSLVVAATLMPQQTDKLAQAVGVERGADLLVYLSVIVIYFIVFKIIVKLDRIDKNITEIVRHTAIKNADRTHDQKDE